MTLSFDVLVLPRNRVFRFDQHQVASDYFDASKRHTKIYMCGEMRKMFDQFAALDAATARGVLSPQQTGASELLCPGGKTPGRAVYYKPSLHEQHRRDRGKVDETLVSKSCNSAPAGAPGLDSLEDPASVVARQVLLRSRQLAVRQQTTRLLVQLRSRLAMLALTSD
eukprot:2249765-Pleurochrysis_carterae.AAC.1